MNVASLLGSDRRSPSPAVSSFEELQSTASHETNVDAPRRRRLLVLWEGGMVQYDLPARGRILLGRGKECDVQIDHASVSRKHVAIEIGDAYTIEDLGSSNGTRIDDRQLKRGDVTRVGAEMQVKLGGTTLILPPLRSVGTTNDTNEPVVGMTMRSLYGEIEAVARGKLPVLFFGETGVGKEVLVRELHRRSPRANGPFVGLSCASLPEALLEKEFFGTEDGRPGLVESASGGTFMLDEVADLPLGMQAKLLRLLESGEVMRIGSLEPRKIDVRFVATTNRNLEELVAANRFRADLFYRLRGAKIVVPPLRERRSEIATLAISFASAAGRDLGRASTAIMPAAMAALERHPWPGNVRELKNLIERAVLLARDGAVGVDQLGDFTAASTQKVIATIPPAADGSFAKGSGDLRAELGALERERIRAALAQCEGNQSRAAKVLGISRRTLISRLDAHQLPRPRKRVGDEE